MSSRPITPLFELALAIREAVLPPDAPELRLSVKNLANTYRNLGRFAEGEPLYRRSLGLQYSKRASECHTTCELKATEPRKRLSLC